MFSLTNVVRRRTINNTTFISSPINFIHSSSISSTVSPFYHHLSFNCTNQKNKHNVSSYSLFNKKSFSISSPYRTHTTHMNAHSASSPDHLPYSSKSSNSSNSETSSSSSSSSQSSSTSSTTSTATTITAATDSTKKKTFAIEGLIFLIVTYIWAILLIIPMIIAHPFVLLFDKGSRRFHDFIAMAWMRWSCSTVGVTPQVINYEKIPKINDKPVVYIANHTSYLDIFVFSYLFRRIKYVSKAEIFKIPIVGWAMAMAGNIALIRSSKKDQIKAYKNMLNTIKNGLSLVIFPEGTRSKNGILKRFKTGAFKAAKENNVNIVPITILGTIDVMPYYALVPLHYPKTPISIIVHDPIDTKNLSIQQISDRAFKAVDSALPDHLRSYDQIKQNQISTDDKKG